MATGGVDVSCDNERSLQILDGSKGLAVIVTNDYTDNVISNKTTLLDTHEDGRVLKQTFEQLQFTTYWEKNATGRKIKELVLEINSMNHPRCNPNGYRCIVFAFSGHGGDDDVLIGQDDSQVHLQNDIITQLSLNRNIAEIPKLFFIDACRGRARKGKSLSDESDESDDSDLTKCDDTLPTDADRQTLAQIITELEGNFLVGYATLSKKQAFINQGDVNQRGSIWMQELAKELRESDDSVQNIMDNVIRKIYQKYIKNFHKKFQQPETISRLVCGPLRLKDQPSAPLNPEEVNINGMEECVRTIDSGQNSPRSCADSLRVSDDDHVEGHLDEAHQGDGAAVNERVDIEINEQPVDQGGHNSKLRSFFQGIFGLGDKEQVEPLTGVGFFARGDST